MHVLYLLLKVPGQTFHNISYWYLHVLTKGSGANLCTILVLTCTHRQCDLVSFKSLEKTSEHVYFGLLPYVETLDDSDIRHSVKFEG